MRGTVRPQRERIYLVPRWAGLVLALVVLLIFALGYVLPDSRGLTQILGITLVVAAVVALIQTNENLRGVVISGCRCVPVAAGEDAVLELLVRNVSDRERVGLRVREGVRWMAAWRKRSGASAWVPVLEAGETLTVRLGIPTGVRGRYGVPPLWVGSVMPMGLCFAWKIFPDCGEYFVYPAPRGVPLDSGRAWGKQAGVVLDQGGEDVSGHRVYAAGDLLTRMDWRVFARTGKLVVRTLEESGGGEVALRWADTHFLPDSETRLQQLSFWMAQCQHEGRAFSLVLDGARGELNSNTVAACHEALATFGERA